MSVKNCLRKLFQIRRGLQVVGAHKILPTNDNLSETKKPGTRSGAGLKNWRPLGILKFGSVPTLLRVLAFPTKSLP